MQRFYVNHCGEVFLSLKLNAELCSTMDPAVSIQKHRSIFLSVIENTEKLCTNIYLTRCRVQAFNLQTLLLNDEQLNQLRYPQVGGHFESLHSQILDEALPLLYLAIPEDLAKYYEKEKLFGHKVFDDFPSSRFDIREAGNCLATDRNTAAVFHLMRAVEWGLRALSVDLGVLTVPHKKVSIPIEFAEWDRIVNQLHTAAEARVNALPPSTLKQELQEFYFPLLKDVQGFKDAFRNHIMHTRKCYSPKQASDVLDHVERFMQRLSERVRE